VWNTNSYFWEEKGVAKWAEERMKGILSGFRHTFAGGELFITEVKSFGGESSVSIRKGKKIVSYDYNSKLKWECNFKDGDGNIVGTIKGEYDMPEISNDVADDGEDWEVRISV
jgi:activator of HSP90 ATPase